MRDLFSHVITPISLENWFPLHETFPKLLSSSNPYLTYITRNTKENKWKEGMLPISPGDMNNSCEDIGDENDPPALENRLSFSLLIGSLSGCMITILGK